MEYRHLGRTDIKVSAVGMGTWQWGARYWGYGEEYDRNDLVGIMEKAWGLGINFLDTAEVYGRGASERLIGQLRPRDEEWVIATKYLPFRPSWPGVERAAERSLRRLKVDVIDLYQIHTPDPLVPMHGLMREMEKLIKRGKIRHIGVSNYSARLMEKARQELSFSDLVSNQIHYNLIYRQPEQNGTLDYCRKNGISVIAYSPLEQGLLTSKYKPSTPVPGMRKWRRSFSKGRRERIQPLLQVMMVISEAHGKSISELALNWLINKPETIVIPGIRNVRHAVDNAGATDWRLTQEEERRIEEAYLGYIAT